MHISVDFWGFLFGITLFLLLVYKIAELVQAYVLPFLKDQMHVIKKEKTELLNREKLMTSSLSKVENQQQQQKKMFLLLEKKMQMWHSQMQKEITGKEENLKDIMLCLEKKRAIQTHNFATMKTMQHVMPGVIDQIRSDLTAYYSTGNKGINGCIERFQTVVKGEQ